MQHPFHKEIYDVRYKKYRKELEKDWNTCVKLEMCAHWIYKLAFSCGPINYGQVIALWGWDSQGGDPTQPFGCNQHIKC